LSVAPGNGPQRSPPQKIPCIKMVLDFLCFIITLILLPSIASNRSGLYISEVGYHSPTSSQNMGSKRAQYLPIMAKISINRLKNNKKTH
jgi:hypothetical protein